MTGTRKRLRRAQRPYTCQPIMAEKPFWDVKPLARMTQAEWESLCDGCGRCCLVRFEDEETGEVIPTRIACRLLDCSTGRCGDYARRKRLVPECIKLTPGAIEALTWMPMTCAYRRLHEGRGLPDWHPLVTGDPQSAARAGISIAGQVVSETALSDPLDALDFEAPELARDPTED